jgi:NADPH:quinone reductase-like Zn-dependent oxidoreductase
VRAMVTPRFGGTDLFEERDVERPEPAAGEVLVRVLAAGTNPVDAKFRAEGDSVGLEAPIVLGADISGVVEEIGPGVTDLAPGDEVYYTPEVFGPRSNGAYAEYHAARADIVARKPSTLSHEEAAAVPLAGGTAYEAVVRRLALNAWCEFRDHHPSKSAKANRGRPSCSLSQIEKLCKAILAAKRARNPLSSWGRSRHRPKALNSLS